MKVLDKQILRVYAGNFYEEKTALWYSRGFHKVLKHCAVVCGNKKDKIKIRRASIEELFDAVRMARVLRNDEVHFKGRVITEHPYLADEWADSIDKALDGIPKLLATNNQSFKTQLW